MSDSDIFQITVVQFNLITVVLSLGAKLFPSDPSPSSVVLFLENEEMDTRVTVRVVVQ